MALSEQQYIALCKNKLEERFSFGNGHGHTQRDLEVLSQKIEEKTGVNISLSTLKRLWKNDFKQSPQLATLNALALMLDYQDWQDFKVRNKKPSGTSKHLLAGILTGLAIVVITSFIIRGLGNKNGNDPKFSKPVKINGPIEFSAEKTVTSGIPNTVIFKYDVSHVEADSFYIQQTWNDFHRKQIDPNGHAVSDIYYESGFHRARLFANDSIIAMQPIHILSNGWEPHIYYDERDLIPIDFAGETFIENGELHLDKSLLAKRNVDLSRYFYSRISNSQIFDVSSDNFNFTTRVKSDTVLESLCPWINLIIVTDVHIFRVALQNKGCERYAGYKLGEIVRNGEDNDLSALGCEIYNWQDVGVVVRDKNAEIYINGEKTFSETFKEDFGKIVGLIYIFEGTGSIGYVKLEDGNGRVAFEDDFERNAIG